MADGQRSKKPEPQSSVLCGAKFTRKKLNKFIPANIHNQNCFEFFYVTREKNLITNIRATIVFVLNNSTHTSWYLLVEVQGGLTTRNRFFNWFGKNTIARHHQKVNQNDQGCVSSLMEQRLVAGEKSLAETVWKLIDKPFRLALCFFFLTFTNLLLSMRNKCHRKFQIVLICSELWMVCVYMFTIEI